MFFLKGGIGFGVLCLEFACGGKWFHEGLRIMDLGKKKLGRATLAQKSFCVSGLKTTVALSADGLILKISSMEDEG